MTNKTTKINYFNYFSKKYIFLYVLFTLIQKTMLVITPLSMQWIIDAANNQQGLERITQLALLALIILIVFSISLALRTYFKEMAENQAIYALKKEIVLKVVQIPYEDLQAKDIGYYLQRLNIDVDKISFLIIEKNVDGVINLLYGFAIAFVMFSLNPLITCCLLLMFPLFIAISHYFIPRIEKYTSEVMSADEKLNTLLEEEISGNYTIRVNNLIHFFVSKNDKLIKHTVKKQIKLLSYDIIYDVVLITFMMNLANLFIYWEGGSMLQLGHLSMGILVALTLYFSRIWAPVEFFLEYNKKLKVARISEMRLFELLAAPESFHEILTINEFDNIRFEDVNLTYAKPLFNKLNFKLFKYDKIGIMGGNGCGKSTLANLIVKLIEPQSGTIYYNDIDYTKISQTQLAEHVYLISAEPFIFDMSILDNIYFGDAMDNPYIQEVLLSKFTQEQLSGSANSLSSGEKKIIQILRAIHVDAEVFIFDEPLNYIDKEYRALLFTLIENYFKAKTLLIISHDVEIFSHCNDCYELTDGQLIKKI